MFDVGFKNYKYLQEKYPPGTRIQLIRMQDPYPLPAGSKGTVISVGRLGNIFMNWDDGSTLSLCVGIDDFKIIKE